MPGSIKHVGGNILGLKPSHKRTLERTLLRRMDPNKLISVELGQHLAAISAEIGRQVGVLINRQGRVEQTFVGEPTRIYLPDLGRARVGSAHFRGLRHVHTVLLGSKKAGGLHRDDLVDLTKLRLDCVAALDVTAAGEAQALSYALNRPGAQAAQQGSSVHQVASLHALGNDFAELIASLEQEQARKVAAHVTDDAAERAIVVGVYPDRATSVWRLEELQELAATAGVQVVDTLIQLRKRPDSKFLVGSGKLEEAVLRALDADANLMLIDHNLTPTQARAIAALADIRVIDRTQLILDIFARHAQSRDGKLQVELAQLKYTLPRLTDMDAGLSRLSGGIGGRGPGETKLEINRRRARDRITRLEREIKALSENRALRRQRRQSGTQPMVSIVGYTNAGKSTLLNKLTGSAVLVANKLFATLDPTSRRLQLTPQLSAIVTDTVGFIRDLPPDLVAAFRATLEELEGADLLLHVVDMGDPMREAKIEAVQAMLETLHLVNIRSLLVLNKADTQEEFVSRALCDKLSAVAVSSLSGQGLAELKAEMAALLGGAHPSL
jgi:GTP-binding protein HflX